MTDTTTTPSGSDDQGTAQTAQNQAENSTGQAQSTPTPLDVQQAAQQPANAAQGDDSDSSDQSTADLPAWAQRELERARKDAARYRQERSDTAEQVKAEADARLQAVLKAAGIDTGEGDDPEQAAAADRQAREKAEADARTARVELAVFKAAADQGADAAALLDSRSFLDRVADLDPTDADAISAAIGEHVQAHPRLAVTQAATRSSADFTGGSGDGAITPEKFKGMDMAARNALYLSDPDTYRRLAATTK